MSSRTLDDVVEPWELHSELVFVSPEVYERAREHLPERDPYTFLTARSRAPDVVPSATGPRLPVALLGYTVWRLAETARVALIAVVVITALVLLAQLAHG